MHGVCVCVCVSVREELYNSLVPQTHKELDSLVSLLGVSRHRCIVLNGGCRETHTVTSHLRLLVLLTQPIFTVDPVMLVFMTRDTADYM